MNKTQNNTTQNPHAPGLVDRSEETAKRIRPQPSWDVDYPGIPHCSVKCHYYTKITKEHNGRVEVLDHCEAMEEVPALGDMCWDCAICIPALAVKG